MLGVVVNAVAILIGGGIGLLVKRGIPERFSSAIMAGIGLCVLLVGVYGTIHGMLSGGSEINLIITIVLGVVAGTALRIDERLNKLGQKIEQKFSPAGKDGEIKKTSISQGFVTSSLLFCVGAMAILGSINSGLSGDHSILFTKSTIDMISALILAVTLGFGVLFSAVAVFVYQGLLVLLAQALRPLLDSYSLIAEIRGAGSILIVALGLNMLGITKLKVADFLPAVFFAPVVYYVARLF